MRIPGPSQQPLHRVVEEAPARIGHVLVRLHLLQRVVRLRVESELLAHVLDEVLLRPAGTQQTYDPLRRMSRMGRDQGRLAPVRPRPARPPDRLARLTAAMFRRSTSVDPEANLAHGAARAQCVQSHIISAVGPCFFSDWSEAQTAGNPDHQRIRVPSIRRLRSRFRRATVSTGTRLAPWAPWGM